LIKRARSKKRPFPILLLVVALLLGFGAWQQASLATPTSAAEEGQIEMQPPPGYYADSVRIELKTAVPHATILYTQDGQLPTPANSTLYTEPIILDQQEAQVAIIRARQQRPDGTLGPVVNATYAIGIQSDLPLLSFIVSPDDLWSANHGILANPFNKGIDWERPVYATYIDQDRASGFAVAAGVRVHGGFTRTYEKTSFRLYFRTRYGPGRLEYPLFDVAPPEVISSFNQLVVHSGGQDSPQPDVRWALMRSQLVAELAFALDGFATRSQPVLLFINGESRGIYYLRERVTEDLLQDNWQVPQADLLDTPYLPETAVPVAGSREQWDHLVAYLESHDLTRPEAYAYVQTQVDMENLLDYLLLQIYTANYDWPQHNVNLFRPRVQGGRWRWIFWDNDFGFALDGGSQPDLDMMNQALKLDRENRLTREDTLLLRKLLENEQFQAAFLQRAAVLLNDSLAPETVMAHIDTLAAALEADIGYEVAAWSSNSVWAANVETLRSFAVARPNFMRQHLVDYFALPGTAEFTFLPPTEGEGQIAVNGHLLETLPWQGTYFQTTAVQVTAVPQPGYQFVGWAEGESAAHLNTAVNQDRTFTPRFAPAPENAPRPGDVVIEEVHRSATGDIEGDWFVLRVLRPGGVDLRGWRLTDNDSKTATDEGSLIFSQDPALANLPEGTLLLVVAMPTVHNDTRFAHLPLTSEAGRYLFYAGGPYVDSQTDPWFRLGPQDNVALLAPGATADFADDVGIYFAAIGQNTAVTPATFGILSDGVTLAEGQP
jgi:hypothetical protein